MKFPPKKVLVSLDPSEASRAACAAAKGLQERFGSVPEAVFVRDTEFGFGLPRSSAGAAEELEQAVRSRLSKCLGGAIPLKVRTGQVALEVAAQAQRCRADLVVVGTHARQGLMRLLAGSVAETIVRAVRTPVWVASGTSRRIRRILAPVSFTAYSDRALSLAAEAAQAFGATLDLIHVATEGDERKTRRLLESRAAGLPKALRAAARLKLPSGRPSLEIARAARECDLIVLSAHRRSFLEDSVLGTTAERVLRLSPVPVLTLPSEEPKSKPPPASQG